MKLETWVKILVVILGLNLLFVIMNYFRSDPVNVTPSEIQNMLDTQRYEISRDNNKKVRDEAFKIMDSVNVLLHDDSNWDSLRTAAFGQ